MMGWYGSGMHGGAGIFMGLFWIVLIAAIIWLVVRLLPTGTHASGAHPSAAPPAPVDPAPVRESPIDLLDHRFARGEIDLETYQAHRAALLAARGGK